MYISLLNKIPFDTLSWVTAYKGLLYEVHITGDIHLGCSISSYFITKIRLKKLSDLADNFISRRIDLKWKKLKVHCISGDELILQPQIYSTIYIFFRIYLVCLFSTFTLPVTHCDGIFRANPGVVEAVILLVII